MTTINPLTGRSIKNGGTLYKQLIRDQVITVFMNVNTVERDENNNMRILPREIIVNEIAMQLPLKSLRDLCTTNVENSQLCLDSAFLSKWGRQHPDEASGMMEYLAAKQRWNLLTSLMQAFEWDSKSKYLAFIYALEYELEPTSKLYTYLEQYDFVKSNYLFGVLYYKPDLLGQPSLFQVWSELPFL